MTIITKEFVGYIIKTNPKSCVDVVISCARDGKKHWKTLFEHGFADVIAATPGLKRYFFRNLCIDLIPKHGNVIFEAYLNSLAPKFHQEFFSETALKHKDHPANHLFSKASVEKVTGDLSLQMLGTLLKAGLAGQPMQQLALRRHLDVQRACKGGNQKFLNFVFSNVGPAPEKLLIHVVENVPDDFEIFLTALFKIPGLLLQFMEPEVQYRGKEDVAQFIGAVGARAWREPERSDKTVTKLSTAIVK